MLRMGDTQSENNAYRMPKSNLPTELQPLEIPRIEKVNCQIKGERIKNELRPNILRIQLCKKRQGKIYGKNKKFYKKAHRILLVKNRPWCA